MTRTVKAQFERAAGGAEGEKSRSFTLSFSSEEPYMRYDGNEILDHADGAVDLSRLQELGVVLFNHNPDQVIGRIDSAKVENHRGIASITFDEDELAETIYQKVANGTLKGVSVGYKIARKEWIARGKTSKCKRFTGPCNVARSWMPFEISIVSVPADPTVGVNRAAEMWAERENMYETCLRQLQYNRTKFGR